MLKHWAFWGCLLAATPALAEAPFWTESPLDTGIGANTPLTANAFSRLAAAAAPAVVTIETETVRHQQMDPFFYFWGFDAPELMQKGAGSGFIIRKDGYILSNNHVVEGAGRIDVHLQDGRSFEAKLVGTDPATDVAVIKLDLGSEELPVVPLGDSDALAIGDFVAAIGNPLGLSHTLTVGIVSAKGRREVHPDGRIQYPDFIQTDASINPGNSGGPLFNLRGEVVGINTAISAQGQGIGFAVPINMAKSILPQLIESGTVERSWIGVQIQEVTKDLAQAFGLDQVQGALIVSVVDGSPAAKAGLKEGDIILKFDGKKIQRHNDLPLLASTAGVGHRAEVEYVRDGKKKTVDLTMERMPGKSKKASRTKGLEEQQKAVSLDALGLKLASLSAAKARQLGIEQGVLITAIEENSPARGLRVGDVIVRFNGKDVETPEDIKKILKDHRKGTAVRILVQREGGRAFERFTL